MELFNEKRRPFAVIFLTVFIYLLGFGIIIPILPLLSTQMGASPFTAGALMSVYSLMQFLFSPFWGRLSDKYGRRPILLICLIGEVFSYILFALSKNLEFLFLARIMSGFFGASISTASAYISDLTPKEERSKGMALIGAAFGLGFLFGPAIGGALTLWAEYLSPDIAFKTSFSSYWVAGLCLFTFIFAFFNLKETIHLKKENSSKDNGLSDFKPNSSEATSIHLKNDSTQDKPLTTDLDSKSLNQPLNKKPTRLENLVIYFNKPVIGSLIAVFFLSSLAMSMMEATLVLFMKAQFGWGLKEVSFGFAFVGLAIIFTQGFLVRRLIPKLGERQVLRTGLIFMSMGMALTSMAQSIFIIAIAQAFVALGIGFINPSTLGSISVLVDDSDQGVALGVTQSMSSLGRILGPIIGGSLFGALTIGSPFIMAGLMTLIGLLLVISNFEQLPATGKKTEIKNAE